MRRERVKQKDMEGQLPKIKEEANGDFVKWRYIEKETRPSS